MERSDRSAVQIRLPPYLKEMPIYEYRCEKCGKEFEEHQSIHDKPLKECKYCKGPVKKLISRVGIQFKGSGFHVTDYGKKHSEPSKTSDNKSDTAAAEKSK